MCIFHNWSKWSLPFPSTYRKAMGNFGDSVTVPVVIQKRVCKKCGKAQVTCVQEGNLEAYTDKRLINDDAKWLVENTEPGPEREHILKVLWASTVKPIHDKGRGACHIQHEG